MQTILLASENTGILTEKHEKKLIIFYAENKNRTLRPCARKQAATNKKNERTREEKKFGERILVKTTSTPQN